jgi:signal transduction histidine kinase/CheY-like chemotaxis protein
MTCAFVVLREWLALRKGLASFRRKISSLFPGAERLQNRAFGQGPDHDAVRLESLKDAHWHYTEREARFRQLLDSQDHLIVRRDECGRIIFANEAFWQTFEVAEGAVPGSTFEPKVAAEEPETRAVSALGKPCRSIVQEVETRAGPRWILWEIQDITASNRSIETLTVGRDVTAERARDQDLRQARDQAEAASRAKSRFLAAMSHEIRTPMNGILGMAELLDATPQTSEQNIYTAAIRSSAGALRAVIDEILDFSSIEAGKLKLSVRAFSLSHCIEQAMLLLAPNAERKGLTLDWSVAEGICDMLEGDEDRLRQILLNLISNAIKFTDNGGVSVAVGAGGTPAIQDGSYPLAIAVTDTGIGFADGDLAQMFDEFEQTEAAILRGDGGTGLGLAISRSLARAMGGDISAQGRPGHGATFTIRICLKQTDSPVCARAVSGGDRNDAVPSSQRSRKAVRNAPEAVSGSKPRVLIAEDNAVNALLARRVVESRGCEAVVVGTGRAAVAAMASAIAKAVPPFDLVLMDIYMPELDGLAATRSIFGLAPSLLIDTSRLPPIVALTANAFAEDRERCLAAGMVDYLAKPFDAAQLEDVLERWVYEPLRQRAMEAQSPAA